MLMFRMLLPTKQLLLMMVVVMMMMGMMEMMMMMMVMGMMVMIINAHVSHAAHQASVSANTQRKVTEFDAFPKFAESHPQRLCFRGKLGSLLSLAAGLIPTWADLFYDSPACCRIGWRGL